MKSKVRIALVFLVTLMLSGCGGCRTPSHRYIYGLARDALKTDATVPKGAKPLPIDEASVGVAKNSASVDLPYEYKDADGQTRRGVHTVWFKRVARTWTVERMNPAHTPDS